MKKALIITYYWPPSGGAGVQRWLKFVKYLRDCGWESVIYTPENGEMPNIDASLQKDVPSNTIVLKTPIREPYAAYKRFIGQKSSEKINTGFLTESRKPKFAEKFAIWVRGNFFIPDARKFWIKPSVKYLLKYLRKNPVDVLISTGPPHSMHLIALALKKKLNIPWLADFRDPWTNIDYYKDLMLTTFADKKHHRLERDVITNADCVVSVTPTMTNDFIQNFGFTSSKSKFITITNGFDEDDIYNGEVELDKKFSIAHIGTLVKSRNPEVLWSVLSELVKTNNEFSKYLEIKLVGKVDITVWESLEQKQLTPFVNKIDYLPHDEVIKFQQQSQVLLLLVNNTKNAKGILTGKIFEYLSAKRPIIGIGPVDGDAAQVLRQTQSGEMSDYNDAENLKKIILIYFEKYKSGGLTINSCETIHYSRKSLTALLATALNKITVK